PGKETICAPATCGDANDQLLAAATCDGAGACTKPAASSCSPFACDPKGGCRTSCTSTADCASGFTCHGSACEAPKAACSEDGRSLVDSEGRSASCTPLRCRDGACLLTCTSTDDCAPGTICNGSACIAAPTTDAAAAESSSGCGTHGNSLGSTVGWSALFI